MEWYSKLALVFTFAVFAAVWMSIQAVGPDEPSARAEVQRVLFQARADGANHAR